MPYQRLPNNLPDILRSKGLRVVEVPGWQTRGRPASTGDFAPVGVLNHHTATNRTDWTNQRVVNLLVNGRADLPGPLSQLGLDRDGVVYIVASGRCNHAGTARASGTVAAGDGNKLYIGLEVFNDGVGEHYPPAQYDAQVLLNAVLSVEITGNSVNTVRGHKETSTSGKPDPRFDMNAFRAQVAAKMTELVEPDDPIDDDPDDPETTVAGFGLWMWYSGKPTTDQILQPGGGWKRTTFKEKPSGIKGPSSEHRMLYSRVEIEQAGEQVLESKFVRTNGDGTAYHCLPLSELRPDWPYVNTHFEEGDTGAGGEWWVRLTGGKPVKLTTRYAKQHTFHPLPAP
jgi:hypothetical protein